MIYFYRFLFFPIFFILAPYYLWRMWKRGGYLTHFFQRFGLLQKFPKNLRKKRIWIQAVSVGEIQAIQPLIEKLSQDNNIEIFLTTTTSTGFKRACELFTKKVLAVNFFPLDFFIFNKLAWARVQPDLCFLMESELWPEHIYSAHSKKIPIFLINGRISDRSFARYCKFKSISKLLLKKITKILACSDLDAKRFVEIGAPQNNVTSIGNLKLDLVFEFLSNIQKIELKKTLGFEEKTLILVGASTWPEEEFWLINVQKKAIEAGLNVSLLLVPRHAERRNEIIQLLNNQSLPFHIRSKGPAQNVSKIALADTTGELKNLIQIADVVFIGKSLFNNHGGQSPVEPAAGGKAIVYGPHMTNFKAICNQLEHNNASIKVSNESEGTSALLQLLKFEKLRSQLGANAAQWQMSNTGATEKIIKIISIFICNQ